MYRYEEATECFRQSRALLTTSFDGTPRLDTARASIALGAALLSSGSVRNVIQADTILSQVGEMIHTMAAGGTTTGTLGKRCLEDQRAFFGAMASGYQLKGDVAKSKEYLQKKSGVTSTMKAQSRWGKIARKTEAKSDSRSVFAHISMVAKQKADWSAVTDMKSKALEEQTKALLIGHQKAAGDAANSANISKAASVVAAAKVGGVQGAVSVALGGVRGLMGKAKRGTTVAAASGSKRVWRFEGGVAVATRGNEEGNTVVADGLAGDKEKGAIGCVGGEPSSSSARPNETGRPDGDDQEQQQKQQQHDHNHYLHHHHHHQQPQQQQQPLGDGSPPECLSEGGSTASSPPAAATVPNRLVRPLACGCMPKVSNASLFHRREQSRWSMAGVRTAIHVEPSPAARQRRLRQSPHEAAARVVPRRPGGGGIDGGDRGIRHDDGRGRALRRGRHGGRGRGENIWRGSELEDRWREPAPPSVSTDATRTGGRTDAFDIIGRFGDAAPFAYERPKPPADPLLMYSPQRRSRKGRGDDGGKTTTMFNAAAAVAVGTVEPTDVAGYLSAMRVQRGASITAGSGYTGYTYT